LLKIINQTSIEKNEKADSNYFKRRENKIFGTDTEKIVIMNIINSENYSEKIFLD
jgi:hypothetical protein